MDGWARGEREGGVCKVGRKVGARRGKRGEKEPVRWARRSGMGGGRNAAGRKAEGTHLKGKREAKEPGSYRRGVGVGGEEGKENRSVMVVERAR